MTTYTAYWRLELACECPACAKEFDLLEVEPDFFHDNKMQVLEHETVRSKNYKVECPKCDFEFNVDFEY